MSALGVSVMASIAEALASIAPLPYLVADDVSWRVVAANEKAEQLYGGSPVGVALESLLTLDGERAVERAVWRAQTSDEPVDLFFERRDGTLAEVLARAQRLEFGGCTASLIVLEDVSHARLLARSLATAGTERRSLLDALGLGVAELDSSGRILEHNRFGPVEVLFPGGITGRNFFLDIAAGPHAREVFQKYQAWANAIIDAPFREAFEFELGRHVVEAELLAGGFSTCDAIVRLSNVTDRREAEAELRRQTLRAEDEARRSRLVYQTSNLLHQTLDLTDVLETAVAETGRLLGASKCQIAFVDATGGVTIAHEYVRTPLDSSQGLVATFDLLPATAEAIRTLQPVIVEDSRASSTLSASDILGRSGAASAIVAPIAIRREPRGVMTILQSDRTRSWTTGDVELAMSVASQVGLAIGHSEIHERVRRQAEREAIVGRLAVTIHAAASLDDALTRAAHTLLGTLDADGVSVLCRSIQDDEERAWCWERSNDGSVVPVDVTACALGSRAREALEKGTDGDDASLILSTFTARDGIDGVLAIRFRSPEADSDARALVEAVSVHVGIAVGAATLLKAVTSAKQVWEGTFDSLPDGVVVIDSAFAIVRSNHAFARLLKSQNKGLVGLPLTRLLSDATGAAIRDAVALVESGHRSAQIEIEDSNLARWLAVSVSRLETSPSPSFIITIRDITRERTIAEHLAQSSKMASIGQLATGVAHEINTPLATIAGSAQSLERQLSSIGMLRDSERWPAIRERLDAIVEQSFRCKRITRDLLDFAAPTRPKIQECDLGSVVSGAIESLARERATERIRIRESGTKTPILTDPELVGQILINLVSNGLDAIELKPNGKLSVEIRHLAREARIAVKDTGTGIAPDDLERIFDPFYTTKPPGRGTGLGLSISRSIVARLGGRLAATSRPGRGATFTVTLPRKQTAEASD